MEGIYISIDGKEYEITFFTNHRNVTEWFQQCLNCEAKPRIKISVTEKDLIKRINNGFLWKK